MSSRQDHTRIPTDDLKRLIRRLRQDAQRHDHAGNQTARDALRQIVDELLDEIGSRTEPA